MSLEILYLKGDIRVRGKSERRLLFLSLDIFNPEVGLWQSKTTSTLTGDDVWTWDSSADRRSAALEWLREFGIEDAPPPAPVVSNQTFWEKLFGSMLP